MKPRDCWPVLAKKALEGVELAQSRVTLARNKLEQLETSRSKILEMMAEYKSQSNIIQARLHSMSETTNYRHFITQLQLVLKQAEQQISQAQADLATEKSNLMQAELKKMKMDALVEQDLAAVKRWERKMEQKQMDALGVTLYNLKT